ncbi:GIY-YIG nuclease family protein [Phaeodactylibacter xiamenensis]|uniref:GIY-YIG nuclease family protein n=1 Tax=Phaeodactylibacter xiamenensis TaxID=1524460 RepID=UPI003BA86E82
MNRPQSILIFLPDGSPRGIKIAQINNRVMKAILFPRNKFDLAGQRDEVKNVGIYFLFGESSSKAKPLAYIGEGENCFERLKSHNRNKEFWTHAVIFFSQVKSFNKGHVNYLEHTAIKEAKAANRYELENADTPKRPHILEHVEADLLDNFETIKMLLSTLGYPIFDPITRSAREDDEIFTISGSGITAEGDLNDDGFVIYSGSYARLETTNSCHDYIITLREKLLNDGILTPKEDKLQFVKDHLFNSASTAGMVVLGRPVNGWTAWKNKAGKTLDELKRT